MRRDIVGRNEEESHMMQTTNGLCRGRENFVKNRASRRWPVRARACDPGVPTWEGLGQWCALGLHAIFF